MFAGKSSADRTAMWLVVKSAVAVWERRLLEQQTLVASADGASDLRKMGGLAGDKRTLKQIEGYTGMWQQLSIGIRNDASIWAAIRPELRFLDAALPLQTDTEVRAYAAKEFCPAEGMDAAELRERLRATCVGLERLQQTSYGTLLEKIQEVEAALARTTEDESGPWAAAGGAEELTFDTCVCARAAAAVFWPSHPPPSPPSPGTPSRP